LLNSLPTGSQFSISDVSFGPDGRTIAVGGADVPRGVLFGVAALRVLDLRDERRPRALPAGQGIEIDDVAFDPDGHTLAAAGRDNTIRLTDVRAGTTVVLTGHTGPVNSVAFSPDGGTLASAADDRTVRLWDVPSHKPIGDPLRGHTDSVTRVTFSGDGRTLASASHDSTIRLWTGLLWRSRDEVAGDVCALVGDGLSTTEWQQYAAGIPYRNTCRSEAHD
jgi:WD40 repeat protein